MAHIAGTPRRGPRGPYAKSAQTRTLILDAALEVFAQSGFRRGSLREVAQRVEMSEAGLLHHFPSKSALLAAVLERRDDHSYEMFTLDPRTGRDAIRELVAVATYNATVPGVVELFCTLAAESISPEHPAHEYFQNRYRMIVTTVKEAFDTAAAQGHLREGVDTTSAAIQSVALFDGLQIQWLLDRSALDMASELRRYFDSLLIEPLESAGSNGLPAK